MIRLRLVCYRELGKVAESEGLHLVGRSGSHNHHCAAKAIAPCHSERNEESKTVSVKRPASETNSTTDRQRL